MLFSLLEFIVFIELKGYVVARASRVESEGGSAVEGGFRGCGAPLEIQLFTPHEPVIGLNLAHPWIPEQVALEGGAQLDGSGRHGARPRDRSGARARQRRAAPLQRS